MSFIFRRPGALIALGTSALGGAAYRFAVDPPPSESLNPHTFTPYTLIQKQQVSSTNAIFTLRNREHAPDSDSTKDIEHKGVWSVQIKQPQLQIGRDYTPLPPTTTHLKEGEDVQDIRLLIRKEEGGEVSGYLHRLPDESTVELRGPKIEWDLPQDLREIIFLAGGTGIAPAMQAAQAIGARSGTKMALLWANRRREECVGGVSEGMAGNVMPQAKRKWRSILGFGRSGEGDKKQDTVSGVPASETPSKGLIVQELEALKKRNAAHKSELAIQYYVDEEKTFIKPQDVLARIAATTPEEKGSRVVLISGPDGFIEYWAGKKLWEGGRETQGRLGGVLGQADLRGWKVYKL